MSYANIAQQNVTAEDRAEIYDQLAKITPDFDRMVNYKQTAENIRENERVLVECNRRIAS